MNTKLYTGTGSSNSVTGVGFKPDWVWLKCRSSAKHNNLYDVVRGATKEIYSNLTNAEDTDAQSLKSFNSDGFTVGTGADQNENNATYVAWNWKAGTSFTNDASGTGIGSVDSTGSVNQTSGFSIMSWTGTGANATVAHGLGATPKMMIFKVRDGATAWVVYHKNVGPTKGLFLNTAGTGSTVSAYFQDTNPTSSVFSVGSDADTNGSSKSMITYCFAEKQGYSKFGVYAGNNSSTGGFHYTGFKPAFIIIKRTDSAADWRTYDDKRFRAGGPNNKFNYLQANGDNGEADSDSGGAWDMLSNGFKFYTSDAAINGGGTYIYMAFAENPFVASNFNAATAR